MVDLGKETGERFAKQPKEFIALLCVLFSVCMGSVLGGLNSVGIPVLSSALEDDDGLAYMNFELSTPHVYKSVARTTVHILTLREERMPGMGLKLRIACDISNGEHIDYRMWGFNAMDASIDRSFLTESTPVKRVGNGEYLVSTPSVDGVGLMYTVSDARLPAECDKLILENGHAIERLGVLDLDLAKELALNACLHLLALMFGAYGVFRFRRTIGAV